METLFLIIIFLLTAPSVFPSPYKKIAGVRSQLRSEWSSKEPSPKNFLATGGFFECNTYRVMALGCLKKKERRRWTILTRPFQVCHFKKLIHIAITTADWGRLYKLLDVLLDASICSLAMSIAVKTLIHWLEPTILKSSHPATLPRAHNRVVWWGCIAPLIQLK